MNFAVHLLYILKKTLWNDTRSCTRANFVSDISITSFGKYWEANATYFSCEGCQGLNHVKLGNSYSWRARILCLADPPIVNVLCVYSVAAP